MAECEVADSTLLAGTPGEEVRALRAALDGAGYRESEVVRILGALEMPTRRARNLPRLRRSSEGESSLHVLVRLLFLGLPVEEDVAARALHPVALDRWVKAGVLRLAGGMARSLVRLVPYDDILLTIDPPELIESGAAPDIVSGMTGSSLTLVYATIRRWFPSILDLGTGCGIQALLAAGHAGQVTATDRSLRSLDFARFNANLNGRANIEFASGDAFEPAAGRQFDLIVCNPPFMISPGLRYLYRDSGLEADGFCRKLAREAPAHLREGGYFQMTCEWVHLHNEDWRQRLASWFEGSGCDAFVFHTETQSPAVYADQWIRDTEQDNAELAGRLYEEYLDYYRGLGIKAICTGIVCLRRRSAAANRIRFEEAPPQKPEPFGESIARAFDLGDALELLRDDRLLLAQRLRLAPEVRLEQILRCEAGAWRIEGARLSLSRGIRFSGEVDEHSCRLLARFTGQTPVIDVLCDLAKEFHVELGQVAPPSLGLIRQLIERGFLIPEGMEWPDGNAAGLPPSLT
jgi:hypothetical protein